MSNELDISKKGLVGRMVIGETEDFIYNINTQAAGEGKDICDNINRNQHKNFLLLYFRVQWCSYFIPEMHAWNFSPQQFWKYHRIWDIWNSATHKILTDVHGTLFRECDLKCKYSPNFCWQYVYCSPMVGTQNNDFGGLRLILRSVKTTEPLLSTNFQMEIPETVRKYQTQTFALLECILDCSICWR